MIESKLPNVGTTIFSVMTALAQKAGAVNVSQGFPDYPIDPLLAELLRKATTEGRNQYAPMPGVPELRVRISEKYLRCHGLSVDPDNEVTITPGATAALYTAIATVVRPGDEVVVFEPCYDSYVPSIETVGGVVLPLPLTQPAYTPDWDLVRRTISPRTRMIIINSPHNPCGSTLSMQDIDTLAEIANEHNLIVLSDEVYELITYDGVRHVSPLMHPDLRDRCFVVSSFGKTFHITGWKIGACVASPELTREFRKVHQFVSFCVNAPAQYALSDYMEDAGRYLGLQDFFTKKRDMLREQLAGSRWTLRPCTGSYFQLIGYEKISEESDTELAVRLVNEFGVACIPLSPFYQGANHTLDRVLRVCFAKTDETIRLAAERLRSV